MTPYLAESVYRGVGGEKESVHLEEWPQNVGEPDTKLIADMAEVRRIASIALEVRQRTGIKVRQPLSKITIKNDSLQSEPELLKVLCEEINVKECVVDTAQAEEVVLDTELTDELRQEGAVRDIVRAVQDMRKKAGLSPEDKVTLTVATSDEGKRLLETASDELTRVAGVETITYEDIEEGTSFTVETTLFVAILTKL